MDGRVGMLGLLVLLLAGCGGGSSGLDERSQVALEPVPEVEPEPVLPTGPVKVGLLLPLSGPAAGAGQDMLDAALMALFDMPPNDVELLPRDTAGDPARAAEVAQDVIEAGAELILGPLYSSSTLAVRDVAAASGIKVISYSSNVQVAGDGVFVLGYRPEEQVKRVVRHAIGQGYPRVAFVGPDDAYGAVALEGYRSALQASALNTQGRVALYPPDAVDQSDAVRQVSDFAARAAVVDAQRRQLEARGDAAALKALEGIDTQTPPPFDAVLIADGGTRLQSVGALMAFFDVNQPPIRFLGTMAWQDDPSVMDEPNLAGSWIAAVDPGMRDAFGERYRSRLGRKPALLAQLAYDSVALAVVIGTEDRTFPEALLTDGQGFAGSGGIFRLLPSGVAEHGLSVISLGPGGVTATIDPAPDRFPDGFAQR